MDEHSRADETDVLTRYCPRCGEPAERLVTLGPGEHRVTTCGCRVTHERFRDLPSEPPEPSRERLTADRRVATDGGHENVTSLRQFREWLDDLRAEGLVVRPDTTSGTHPTADLWTRRPDELCVPDNCTLRSRGPTRVDTPGASTDRPDYWAAYTVTYPVDTAPSDRLSAGSRNSHS